MPLYTRASTVKLGRPTDLPSRSRCRSPAPTSTPPLSSTSLASQDSYSAPSTPPLPSSDDARLSQAWSLVSATAPADPCPSPLTLGLENHGRSRSKSSSREPSAEKVGGRVGRFFRRIRSRRSLRGDADEQDRAADEVEKVPPIPNLPPRLELLQLPVLGPAFEFVDSSQAPASCPAQGGLDLDVNLDDFASFAYLIRAAGDKVVDETVPPPTKPTPTSPVARTMHRLYHLATPAPRPLSAASMDDYGEASDEDNSDTRAGPDAPLRTAPNFVTPPTSPIYVRSPSPRTPLSPRPPLSPNPTVARIISHARSRISPSSATSLWPPTHAPWPVSLLPPPRSTYSCQTLCSTVSHITNRSLSTSLAHRLVLKKAQRSTLLEGAELAHTSSERSGSPSPPFPPPTHLPPSLPCTRLQEWAARPSFPERSLVHTHDGTDIVRARIRGGLLVWSVRLRAWLDALADGAAEPARQDECGPEKRPAREPRRGELISSHAPVGRGCRSPSAEERLRPPSSAQAAPSAPRLDAGVSTSPTRLVVSDPLLRRQKARKEAEAALVGARLSDGPAQPVVDHADPDEDERPLATLSRSRSSRGISRLPPPTLAPPVPALLVVQRKAAQLEAEVERLRAREARRAAEEAEGVAAREREMRYERAYRRAEGQRRRSRAMQSAALPVGPERETRRRSTAPPPASPSPPSPFSHAPYLAVPAQGWGMSIPTLAVPIPIPVPVPMYQLPMHALSAPNLQALQLPPQPHHPSFGARRQSFQPPSPSTPALARRPERHSFHPDPSPATVRHSRSTPDVPHVTASLHTPPRAGGQDKRASYNPPVPLVTIPGMSPGEKERR